MSYQQTIYNLLRQAGMTESGALGVIGNFDCESNCEPCRVQGDYASNRLISKEYVEKVMSGAISRDSFAHDQKGFGLAQWTWYTRKYALYDFWKVYGGRIDDVTMQVEFALKELKSGEYICHFKKEDEEERKLYGVSLDLWKLLKDTKSIYIAAKWTCKVYENPAVHNVDARYHAALRIKGELQLGQWENTEVIIPDKPAENTQKPDEGWEQVPATEFWPPRTLCVGMKGKDVIAIRGLLYAREWDVKTVDNEEYDIPLKETVVKFQKAAFPDQPTEWDGIAGKKTFGKLMSV